MTASLPSIEHSSSASSILDDKKALPEVSERAFPDPDDCCGGLIDCDLYYDKGLQPSNGVR